MKRKKKRKKKRKEGQEEIEQRNNNSKGRNLSAKGKREQIREGMVETQEGNPPRIFR